MTVGGSEGACGRQCFFIESGKTCVRDYCVEKAEPHVEVKKVFEFETKHISRPEREEESEKGVAALCDHTFQ